MGLLFSYSLRNLWTRRMTTVLTAGGMALVVFVFAAVLMLSEGLKKTLVDTGSYSNAVVLRKASASEVQSGIERDKADIVEVQPEVASDRDGQRMVAKELVVLITLPKRGSDKPSNVQVRGIGEKSMALRPQVRLIEGRMPRKGSYEIAAGRKIAERFKGAGIGESLHFGMRDWTVVGIFDAGNTGFSSEVWGDAEPLMQAFRRPVYSSILLKMNESDRFEDFQKRIENDPRLSVETKRESLYYASQSELMSKFLSYLGYTLTAIFSLGAIIGAMITMYAAVSNRISEIGTLRALGFQKATILAAFVMESLLLGFFGGLAGLFMASFLQLFTISTINWQTFGELAFSFALTAGIAWKALVFSLIMGLVGGILPAFRAARMNIIEALRTS